MHITIGQELEVRNSAVLQRQAPFCLDSVCLVMTQVEDGLVKHRHSHWKSGISETLFVFAVRGEIVQHACPRTLSSFVTLEELSWLSYMRSICCCMCGQNDLIEWISGKLCRHQPHHLP